MNSNTEICNNYRKGIENAVRAHAPEKSQLILKYLYMGIVDGEILTHESVTDQILEDSRHLANITDFSEENICRVMYGGDSEQMNHDYKDAVSIRERLDDLV